MSQLGGVGAAQAFTHGVRWGRQLQRRTVVWRWQADSTWVSEELLLSA